MSAVVAYQTLFKELKQDKRSPMYLLFGLEESLIAQATHLITEHALAGQDADLRSMNDLRFEGKNLNLDSFAEAVYSAPLFAPYKVVRLSNAPFGTGRAPADKEDTADEVSSTDSSDQLLKILEQSPSSTVLIFEATAVHKNRKLYKLVAKKGAILEFGPLNRAEAQVIVDSETKRLAVSLSAAAVNRLFDLVGVDGRTPCVRTLKNEIQKLAAYKGFSGTISADDVSLMVERSAEAKIWDLTDALSAKDPGKALSSLQELWEDGNEPLRVLASLSKHFGSLLMAKQGLEEGMQPAQVLPLLGLAPYPAQKCMRAARTFSLAELKQGLTWCIELDFGIKSGKRNPLTGLELLVHRFCT